MEGNTIVRLENAAIFHAKDMFREASFRDRRGSDLVLSEVDLTIEAGELVYLIGRVGSGKSTLLKTLYAEIPLKTGYGYVAGYELRKLRRRDIPYLRRRIGIVFQDYQLLTDRDVYHNLLFVLKATGWKDKVMIRERIGRVLDLVGLRNKEHKMPFQLSGGEQQRLSIARALLNDPPLILADEPTGNLDPAATDDIMQLFRDIAQSGHAVVMSTHNIGNIQQVPSRTLRFNHGRIEELDIQSILGF